MENDAEIFPAHYTWKVAEKGLKMASMMNKLAISNSCKIILEKLNKNFAKNHCEIQVRTLLVCALYSIKYGICSRSVYICGFFLLLPHTRGSNHRYLMSTSAI
jgi:hypothetical protein